MINFTENEWMALVVSVPCIIGAVIFWISMRREEKRIDAEHADENESEYCPAERNRRGSFLSERELGRLEGITETVRRLISSGAISVEQGADIMGITPQQLKNRLHIIND